MDDDTDQKVDQIRTTRDGVLKAMAQAHDEIQKRIDATEDRPSLHARLLQRRASLETETESVAQAAVEAVLRLPKIVAAASTIVSIGKRLIDRAGELPAARNFLKKSSQVLDLGTQFVDIFIEKKTAEAGGK